jgi:hypothetical protein
VAHEQLSRILFDRDVSSLTENFASSLGLTINERSWPILDVTVQHALPIRFRFDATAWDDVPPSISLLNPDGTPFSGKVPGGQFNPGPHPSTGRPFVCMRGAKEYHSHPSHIGDVWENYRGHDGMNLLGILMQITAAWRKLAR